MRIGIVSGDTLFREALVSALGNEGNFDVVVQGHNVRKCVEDGKGLKPALYLFDTNGMPHNDLEFLCGAREYGDFGIALITGERDQDDYQEYGAQKICTHATSLPQLIKMIRETGSTFVKKADGRVRPSRGPAGNQFELSKREYEVALLVAKGYSNRKISEVIGLKEQSVKNLVSVIMRKLKCENRVQVALRIVHAKVVDDPT